MNKILLSSILCAVTSTLYAAQINWGFTGPIKFANTSVADKATLTLVCLDGIDDWSKQAINIASEQSSTGVVATKMTNSTGVSAASTGYWTYQWADTTDIANKNIAKGTDFAYMVTFVSDGKKYYWASDVYNVIDSGSNWTNPSLTYTMNSIANSTINTENAWSPVPEPATGMLALAGLAMLIRRKRA